MRRRRRRRGGDGEGRGGEGEGGDGRDDEDGDPVHPAEQSADDQRMKITELTNATTTGVPGPSHPAAFPPCA